MVTYKPGQQTDKDLVLYVKDRQGKSVGEIKVPAGHRIPPTKIKNAESYSTKK